MTRAKTELLASSSLRTVLVTGVALAGMSLLSACADVPANPLAQAQPAAAANPCNPCAAANPCNPCAAANARNPCAAATNTVASGRFYDGPHAPGHRVSGQAHLIKDAQGHYALKFSNFVSDEGPDVNIILTPASAPQTDAAVKSAGYVTIAARKALTGDQTYKLPEDFDPKAYSSVGIWCEQFGVLFGAAHLKPL